MRDARQRWWRSATVVLGTSLLVALLAWPAGAASARTGTSAEAWYQGSLVQDDAPFCILPCPEVAPPANPYPEHTLHVGVSGGREEARTYVALDLSVLPTGAPLQGGTVRLPVAGADAGTAGADAAALVACAVEERIEPVEGGQPDEAPEVDCTTSAPLQPTDEEATAFTFELAPFAQRYSGVGDISFAVLPSEEAVEEGQTWRVVFHGRERGTEDAEPISAEIRYETADPPAAPAPSDDVSDPSPREGFAADPPPAPGSGGFRSEPTSSGFSDPPPVSADAGFDDDADVVEEPEVVGEEQQEEPAPEGEQDLPMVSTGEGYAYPQVWLLPLAFLCVGALLVRSLSKDYEIELDDEALGT